MVYNAYFYALSIVCLLNYQDFAQADINHEIKDKFQLKDSFLCDNSYLETHLETLKLQMEIMQQQLNKQEDLFNRMDKKNNELLLHMQAMQDKLLQDNKLNFEDLKNTLNEQIQNQVRAVVQPPADEIIFILCDMKEILKDHDKALDNVLSKQNNTEKLLRKTNCQNHTKTLAAKISNKLGILEKMVLPVYVENDTWTITEQLKFRCDAQRFLDKNDVTNNNCKGNYHNLFCNSGSYPTNCADLSESPHCVNNKCCISNQIYGPAAFLVSCNNEDIGGGWTVIQRRMDGSVDFYRNWTEYKNGFGDVDGEFFIGLDKLHALTTTLKPMELLIQLEDFDNVTKYAKYDDFQVGNEMENYKLIKVGSYTGDAGDSFSKYKGYDFSIKDRDNNLADTNCCGIGFPITKWFRNCHSSNLNEKSFMKGDIPKKRNGIYWRDFHYEYSSLKFVQMMIRPKRQEIHELKYF